MNAAEQNAFLDVFMSTNGAGLRENDVKDFLKVYETLEDDELYKLYGRELYSATVDAMIVWHRAVYFAKQQALEALSTCKNL